MALQQRVEALQSDHDQLENLLVSVCDLLNQIREGLTQAEFDELSILGHTIRRDLTVIGRRIVAPQPLPHPIAHVEQELRRAQHASADVKHEVDRIVTDLNAQLREPVPAAVRISIGEAVRSVCPELPGQVDHTLAQLVLACTLADQRAAKQDIMRLAVRLATHH